MAEFCVDKVELDPQLRPAHGVLRSSAMLVTADARALAQHLRDEAETEKQAILAAAQDEADAAVRSLQEKTVQDADQLLQVLNNTQARLLSDAEEVIIGIAIQLYDRLVMESTPRDKVLASLRRIQHEAPAKLVNPVLRVHPDDMEHLPDTGWDRKADMSLTPGSVRMEADSGEWFADFTVAADAFRAAFTEASSLSADQLDRAENGEVDEEEGDQDDDDYDGYDEDDDEAH